MESFFLLISLCSCSFLVFSAFAAARFAARRPAFIPALSPLPITILKPLLGIEPELLDNLRSFCRQDYAPYQIIFGLQNDGDPAKAIVGQLQDEFPDLDIALVIESKRAGHNPKVANLINMLPAAKHDYLVIADSDMFVPPDYLRIVTAPLQDQATGLVTCMYRGKPVGGMLSRLGAQHINYGFLPQAVVGDALSSGAGCFGATLALRRDVLMAIGGFEAVQDELADDHALGCAVRKIGKKLILSPLIIDTVVYEPRIARLLDHELRWMRTVRFINPKGYAGSVITHAVALGFLGVILNGTSVLSLAVLTLTIICRIITARIIQKYLQIQDLNPALLLLRDFLSFGEFIISFRSRTVQWRQEKFYVENRRIVG